MTSPEGTELITQFMLEPPDTTSFTQVLSTVIALATGGSIVSGIASATADTTSRKRRVLLFSFLVKNVGPSLYPWVMFTTQVMLIWLVVRSVTWVKEASANCQTATVGFPKR